MGSCGTNLGQTIFLIMCYLERESISPIFNFCWFLTILLEGENNNDYHRFPDRVGTVPLPFLRRTNSTEYR